MRSIKAHWLFQKKVLLLLWTAAWGGNLQVKIMDEVKVVGELEKGFKQVYQVLSPEGLSPTLDCCGGGNRQVKIYDEYEYRIRRLTPKEYGRLMGVSDEDYEKMASVNSNSQLYKQLAILAKW